MSEQLPLTPAQRQTARTLPWYRAWLLSTGRTPQETGASSEATWRHLSAAHGFYDWTRADVEARYSDLDVLHDDDHLERQAELEHTHQEAP
jgi:hypothetical protein